MQKVTTALRKMTTNAATMVQLNRAHNELFRRSPDERFASLSEIVQGNTAKNPRSVSSNVKQQTVCGDVKQENVQNENASGNVGNQNVTARNNFNRIIFNV